MSGTPICPRNLRYDNTLKICSQSVLCPPNRSSSQINLNSSSVQCYAPGSDIINANTKSDPICPTDKILDRTSSKCVTFVYGTCNTPSAMMVQVNKELKCVSCPNNTLKTTYTYDTPSSSCISTFTPSTSTNRPSATGTGIITGTTTITTSPFRL